jgi:hypothetical protein
VVLDYKAIIALLIPLLLITFVQLDVSAMTSIPNANWSLSNNVSLQFSANVTFAEAPHLGYPYDPTLVGYWNMAEGTGTVIHDSTKNGLNATTGNSSWVDGRFDYGINLNTTKYVTIPYSHELDYFDGLTISAWIYPTSWGTYNFIVNKGWQSSGAFLLYFANDGVLNFAVRDSVGQKVATSGSSHLILNQWYYIAATYQKDVDNGVKLYVNGQEFNGTQRTLNESLSKNSDIQISNNAYPLNGVIDEVRIYNRTLSKTDITNLYNLPSASVLDDYFAFSDNQTSGLMMIRASTNQSQTSAVMLDCTNFFQNNKLVIQANDSVVVNLWTTVGKPAYLNSGYWNSENNTITLVLNASTIGELDWNRVPPSASNFSTTSTNAGNITTFSSLWNDAHDLRGGGYIFSTNNSGRWTNYSWTAFTSSSANWGNITLTLNNTVGVTINFREYANNSLGVWGDSGNYEIKTVVKYLPASSQTPTPAPSSETVNPTATSTNPTTTPIPNMVSTSTPTQTSNTATTNSFMTQTIVIVTGAVTAVLFVIFLVSIRKGIIRIEVVTEQNSENSISKDEDDYQI